MSRIGTRGRVLCGIAVAGLLAAWYLGLSPRALWPTEAGWRQLGRFVAAALTPALHSESDLASPLLPRALQAALLTVRFAVAATSLSLVGGAVLGVLASRRWWDLLDLPHAISSPLQVGTRSLCLLYTSPSPRDVEESRMPSSA